MKGLLAQETGLFTVGTVVTVLILLRVLGPGTQVKMARVLTEGSLVPSRASLTSPQWLLTTPTRWALLTPHCSCKLA